MRDQSKGGKGTKRGNTSGGRASGGKGGDAGSQMLAKLAGKIGNDALQGQISKGNATRDEMFAFISQRLSTVRQLQLREISLTYRGAYFDWWKKVSDSHKEQFTTPDPTRWKETGRLYEDAAQQLARGDLERARHVLQDAFAEEQKTKESMTALVDQSNLDTGVGPHTGWMGGVGDTPKVGACALPEDIQIAKDIQNVTASAPDPMNRRRPKDPWWTLDEDEEEEDGANAEG